MRANNLQPGTVLGADFCLEHKLAEGGMGTVYVATQRSTGQRRAVKVFSPEVAVDDDLRARFVQETRIGARIASEHIATVIAAGFEASLPWLAMELLDGDTLTQRVEREGSFGSAMARDFFAQLGHALTEAHRAGVAHRDLKPDNIFIARSQRAGAAFTVKVLDFGIAKIADASRNTTSMSFGTPLWMAPEQMFPGAAAFASDVWSLGLVAFYVLTGRVFWRAGNATVVDFGELARERLAPTTAAASVRATVLLGHSPLPRGFDAWFARCVVADPRARYTTIVEALTVLNAMLAPTSGPALVPPAVQASPRTPAVAYAPTEVQRRSAPVASSPRGPRRVLGGIALAGILSLGLWRWASTGDLPTTPREVPEDPRAPTPPVPHPQPSPDDCPQDMLRIEGASVRLHNGTRHQVQRFCLDRYEVTVDAYARCVDARRCADSRREMRTDGGVNLCNATLSGRGNHPLNCVSYDEAEAYCRWRGARLPTNPEWELGAEGTHPVRTWPWGNRPPDASRINACANECPRNEFRVPSYRFDDGWPSTAPPGTFPAGATPEGVMDLAGNVSEWVRDDSLVGGDRRRRWRGGSCLDGPVPSTRAVHLVPDGQAKDHIGFRCAQ